MTVITLRQKVLDCVAIGASTACLVHCLLLPLLILLVPTLAAFLTLPESFHLGAVIFAVPTSILALAVGYRQHRWSAPLLIVLPGIMLLATGALAVSEEWVETTLTVAGGTILALGHALNWRATSRTCNSVPVLVTKFLRFAREK